MAIRLSLKFGLLWYNEIIRKSLGLDGKEVALRRVIFVCLFVCFLLFKFKMPKKQKHISRFLLLVERLAAYLSKSSKKKIFMTITFNLRI